MGRGVTTRTKSFIASLHDGMVASHILRMAQSKHAISEEEQSLLVDSEAYFQKMDGMAKGEKIFNVGDSSDAMYIVKAGGVMLVHKGSGRRKSSTAAAAVVDENNEIRYPNLQVKIGFVFGDGEFLLGEKRTIEAVAMVDGTEVWRLTRTDWLLMQTEKAEVFYVFQKMLMRILAHQVNRAESFA